MGELPQYEKLASFYLGKKYDFAAAQKRQEEKVLYDAKDLTTHAMCVGMTGSGKTGLCLSLLEEAALDGIPAICIDPKGDLGNLLLSFPDFKASDFRPWIEDADARRKGMEPDEYAAATAEKWKNGLGDWEQEPERVRRFKESVDVAIYTPGSDAGIPMTVLKSFNAPPKEVLEDGDVMRERVAGAASGLLTLMGIEADPLSSQEHILLSNIFEAVWRKGQNLDLPGLIRAIQNPPIEKVGVFDLESFYPAKDRLKLSMTLNNLLASPSFSGWLEGQPLDIKRLMYTPEGKPRLSIISIAHLSDQERMFFVTIMLNELLSWMRSQPGTSSLRALFYMDEVYGYFPPTAKPPSKPPMMVLLKQARAFGLGIALATQNPVDLDYKGLSNIGTWFLGRLQTQRDKDRVIEGLEGAAAQSGAKFDRGAMEETLAALGSRVFLMNNVHDDGPTIFETRWAMSYLRGPLSRQQIKGLMDERREELTPPSKSRKLDSGAAAEEPEANERPVVPNDVEERFLMPTKVPNREAKIRYRPGLLAQVSCHYVRTSAGLDDWFDRTLLYQLGRRLSKDVWEDAHLMPEESLEVDEAPEEGFGFAEVPADMLNDKQYKSWEKDLRDHLYRRMPMRLYECEELDQFSKPGQDEVDARAAWTQAARELRDEEVEKLREKYRKKVDAFEDKIRNAEQRVQREKAQYDQQKWSSMLSIGQTVLGALMGNKISSRGATAGRSVGRAAQQRTDVVHAKETLADLEHDRKELIEESEREIEELKDKYSVESLTLTPLDVPCRKGDLKVETCSLVWIPWEIDPDGIAYPLVDLPEE
ncbi:MAG: DUF87 domain-containing protein [Planctomycetota bacterium]